MSVEKFRLEQEWMIYNRENYLGQWVALDGSKLLAFGPNAQDVYTRARAMVPLPLLTYVDPGEAPL